MPLLTRLLDELFPVPCPSCHRRDARRGPCSACVATFVPPPALPVPLGLRSCSAAVAYDGAARHIVLACKRSATRSLAQTMGDAICARALVDVRLRELDVVTWVPTSRDRIRRRGYDHAAEIATAVARNVGISCRELLARTSPPMDHAGAATHAVTFRPIRAAPPGVLLVDDVRTTGRSLRAAALALRDAGAEVVDAATFAATGLTPPTPATRPPDALTSPPPAARERERTLGSAPRSSARQLGYPQV